MKNLDSKIRLDRALEFAIFSGLKLTITPAEGPKENLTLEIEEVKGGTFKGKIPHKLNPTLAKRILSKQKMIALMNYKSHSLSFETELVSHEGIDETNFTHISMPVFKHPSFGQLTNRRKYPRLSLTGKNLKATFTVEPKGKAMVFESSLVQEISQKGISVLIERKSGLILPKDKVPSFELKLGDRTVLKTEAEVQRVDMKHALAHHVPGYLAVFTLGKKSMDSEISQKECRRASKRVCLLDQKGAFLSFKHPLSPEIEISAHFSDISTSGLSFLVSTSRYPIVPGMILEDAKLQLPLMPPIQTSFQVMHCQEMISEEGHSYRIGAKFTESSLKLLQIVNRLIQKETNPNLVDASADDYEQLWELFFETGFIYPEKRKHIQKFASSLFHTYRQLLNTDTPLLKKILYKEEGQIRGHVSAIKFFDHTWMVQHLNALKTSETASAAQAVIRSITQFFLEDEGNRLADNHYVIFFYRPNNTYPSIFFGEAKKIINNPDICNTVDLDYCVLKHSSEMVALSIDPHISIREATELDLHKLEEILIDKKLYSLMHIEGLNSEDVTQLKISSMYEAIQLYRYRKVFVAHHKETDCYAFAVCNYASPGLNLSELTNSFRIYCSSQDSDIKKALASFITPHVIQSYSTTEMPSPIFLKEENEILPEQFENKKVYRYWHYDLRHSKLFREAIDYITQNMKTLIKNFMECQKNDKVA